MSIEALNWVFQHNRTTKGVDRLVLIALANEADTGTGHAFPEIPTLAAHAVVNRTTVMEARDRLVADGQILAKPPARKGRGHHYEYVVLMGRDPRVVADEWGWSRPALSPTAAARFGPEPQPEMHPAPPSDRKQVSPPSDAKRSARPTFQSPTAATRSHRGPVDNPSSPSDQKGSARPTYTPRKGRERVGKGSAAGRPSPAPSPRRTTTAPRARTHRPVLRVDNQTDGLAELRADLEAAGVLGVDWRLSEKQKQLLLALLQVVDRMQLVEAALRMVDEKGAPRLAAAWVPVWLELQAPSPAPRSRPQPWCGSCSQHDRTVESEDGSVRKCPDCHPAYAML